MRRPDPDTPSSASRRPRLPIVSNDLELLAIVLIWAFNVIVVKVGLREVEPLAYNVVRFVSAAAVLLAWTWRREGSVAIRREDWPRLALLGVLGHAVYQICFIEGVARTTASSVALLFGTTPIVVAVISHLAGHEKLTPWKSASAIVAFCGVTLVVRGSAVHAGPATAMDGAAPIAAAAAAPAGTATAGNLLIVAAVVCWALYTVLARGLLQRYSPLRVAATSLTIGTVLLVPLSLRSFLRQSWRSVSAVTWAGLAFSFLFALVVASVVWYRSVKRVGNVRTAIYSNLVPVFGTLFGVLLLGDRLSAGLWLGGACILAGIMLARVAAPWRPRPTTPAGWPRPSAD